MPVIQDAPINFDEIIDQEFLIPEEPAIEQGEIEEPPMNFDNNEGDWSDEGFYSDDQEFELPEVRAIPVPVAEPTAEPDQGRNLLIIYQTHY